jgi:NADH:ubiquinone reductase (H+-translocating)
LFIVASLVDGRQIESGEPFRIRKDIHLDDPVVGDRESDYQPSSHFFVRVRHCTDGWSVACVTDEWQRHSAHAAEAVLTAALRWRFCWWASPIDLRCGEGMQIGACFIEATVENVDVDGRTVRAVAVDGAPYTLPYDHLVVALGASTNLGLIPGSSHALTFKTMADALVLRNHLIEQFEHADAASGTATRRGCLTVVVIGGGLVGVELLGELTAFADDVLRFYPRIRREEVCFRLFEAGPRILPEIDERLAVVAGRVLGRRGADVRVATPVGAIEPGRVHLANETIDAGTIVLAAGIVPSAIAAAVPVAHDRRGRIAVDATMRSRSHPHVWAVGDCAEIPGPDGRPYPALAQHTVREGPQLARNLRAVADGRAPEPFVFRPLGTMASLGHTRAVARVLGMRLTGFPAWWIRRTYYLFQMPRWDRRLRIVLDWTVALFFRPDITKVELRVERDRRIDAAQPHSGAV